MVSRKSLRVRKSPVVYQAAEQIPKTPKNVTPKPVPPRRTFSRDIELQMECMDDDLSPAQLKAIKDAQKEHEKANDLIKEVRAGNILVPSSQPNTFTIVPPKPPPQPPKPTPPAPVSAPVKAQVLTPSPPKEQRGLPPPRPAQFLNKQIQDMNKGSKPDVILISDVHTQAKAGMTKIPVSQVPSSQMQIRQMGPVLASQGDGVTPQQVYKFVSLPSNMPANVIQNQQWALRPLLTVPPQQQSQLSFLATTQQGMGQLAPVRGVTWQPSQARMPAPRNTNISGEGLQKVGGAKTCGEELKPVFRTNGKQRNIVIQKQYLTPLRRCLTKVGSCSNGAKYQVKTRARSDMSGKTRSIGSHVYSRKIKSHCVRFSVLFDTDRARQSYSKCQGDSYVLPRKSLYQHWLKSIRLKRRKLKLAKASDKHEGSNVFQRDFKSKNSDQSHAILKFVGIKSALEIRNNCDENVCICGQTEAHVCDKFESAKGGGQTFNNKHQTKSISCQVLKERCDMSKRTNTRQYNHSGTSVTNQSSQRSMRTKVLKRQMLRKTIKNDIDRHFDQLSEPFLKPVSQFKRYTVRKPSVKTMKPSLYKLRTSATIERDLANFDKQTDLKQWNKCRKSLYEIVKEQNPKRNIAIVNMVYKSTSGIHSDRQILNSRTMCLSENATIEGKQLIDVTNIHPKIAKETECDKLNDPGDKVSTDLNEMQKYVSIETETGGSSKTPGSTDSDVNNQVENGVQKGDEIGLTIDMIVEDRKNESHISIESEVPDETKNDSVSVEKLTDQDVLKTDEELKSEKTPDFREDPQENHVELENVVSDCCDDVSSEECEKGRDTSTCFGSGVNKWYEDLSSEDAMCIVVLCKKFGCTKMSRDLQIPKTALLKLKRRVRIPEHCNTVTTSYDSNCADANLKSNEVFETVLNENLSEFAEQKDCLNMDTASILQKYHPKLCRTALKMLRDNSFRNVNRVVKKKVRSESRNAHSDLETSPFDQVEQVQSISATQQSVMQAKDTCSVRIEHDSEVDTKTASNDLALDMNDGDCTLDNNEMQDVPRDCVQELNIAISSSHGGWRYETEYHLSSQMAKKDKVDLNLDKYNVLEISKLRDEWHTFMAASHDHCYSKNNHSSDSGTGDIQVRNAGEDADDCSEKHVEETLCEKWEEIVGRKIPVFAPFAEKKLKEVVQYAELLGIDVAARKYCISEDHAWALREHALDFPQKHDGSDFTLNSGIPDDYVSSLGKDGSPRFCCQDPLFNCVNVLPVVKRFPKKKRPRNVPKNTNTTDKRSCAKKATEHPVYTDELIEYAISNNIFTDNRKLGDDQKSMSELIDLVESDSFFESLKTFRYGSGQAMPVHRYPFEFKRKMVILAYKLAVKTVSKAFDINMKTLSGWKKSFNEAVENYHKQRNQAGQVSDEVRLQEIDTDRAGRAKAYVDRLKRVYLSKNLKIKLAHLCEKQGVADIKEQFGFTRKILRRWMREFGNEELSDHSLNDEDYDEISKYRKYKNETRVATSCFFTETNVQSDEGQKASSCTKISENSYIENNSTSSEYHISEMKKDGSLLVTFPNNLEVKLDIEDELNDNPTVPDAMSLYSLFDTNSEANGLQRKSSDRVNIMKTTASAREAEYASMQFSEENSYSLELIESEIFSNRSESEPEDVVEIVSWDVDQDQTFTNHIDISTEIPVLATSSNSVETICHVNDANLCMTPVLNEVERDISVSGRNEPSIDKEEVYDEEGSGVQQVNVSVIINQFDEKKSPRSEKEAEETACAGEAKQQMNVTPKSNGNTLTCQMLPTSEETKGNNESTNERSNSHEDASKEKLNRNGIENLSFDILPDRHLMDSESCEIIYISDSEDVVTPQLPSTFDIKEEPADDEFDRIELGTCSRMPKEGQTPKDENRKNVSDTKHGSELESNVSVSQESRENENSFTINQLGTGDGKSSQGYNFQSSSGSNDSNSQRTDSTNMSGQTGTHDLNDSNLPMSGANIQIVGTQDLIPGQEYIIVDPRVFSSGSSTFQALRPPALIRHELRPPTTVINMTQQSPRVSAVNIMPSQMKAHVKVFESQGMSMNTSRVPQSYGHTPHAPRLTLYGNAGSSRVLQEGRGGPVLTNVKPETQEKLSGRLQVRGIGSSASSTGTKTTVTGTSLLQVPSKQTATFPQTKVRILSPEKIVSHLSRASKTSLEVSTVPSKATTSTAGVHKTTTSSANSDKDKFLSFTLKGLGSISKENISFEVSSNDTKQSTIEEEKDDIEAKEKIQEKTQSNSDSKVKRFLPNSGLCLEKERQLLHTLLLRKSGQKSSYDASDNTVNSPQKASAEAQSSNRIDSLIQKMTDRFQKRKCDSEIETKLSGLNVTQPRLSEKEKNAKPSSASEILFGDNTSPKKRDEFPEKIEKETFQKTLVSFEDEKYENNELTVNKSPFKKDGRKSQLVMRDIDSTEDESSNSSSENTSEIASSSSTLSADTIDEPREGQIEHVDLSTKLKSLLSADIFNVIESQTQNDKEDDDLLEILSHSTSAANVSSSSVKSTTVDESTKRGNKEKNQDIADNEKVMPIEHTNIQTKKGKINYSIDIKMKLGKLASMFSIGSLSKKYNVNSKTLARWKVQFQDEEIAGLELTESELKELEEINKLKISLYGTSAPEYDIYVDNPEEDEQELNIHSKAPKEKGNEVDTNISLEPRESQTRQVEAVKRKTADDIAGSSKSTLIVQKATSKDSARFGTPLYICLGSDTTDEVKQQLRKNVKTQKTAEDDWSNGAFLKTTKVPLASVFGQDVEVPTENASNVNKTERGLSLAVGNKGTTLTDLQRKTLEDTIQDSRNMMWKKTVYLCPDEGIFKYRYEMKKTDDSSSNVSDTNANQTVSILDTLFKTPSESHESSNRQVKKPFPPPLPDDHNISSPSEIAKMLKEPPRQASVSQSISVSDSDKRLQSSRTKPFNREQLLGKSSTNSYSDAFKWTVVKEARVSGFEKTAVMYRISMTDIMKWHDSFLSKKKQQDNIMKTQVSSATGVSSSIVDQTADEEVQKKIADIEEKGVTGKFNANLSFERIQVKEGTIKRPKFSSKLPVIQSDSFALPLSNRPQRTRMGPNSIKYATPRVDPDQLEKFHADVAGDLGIMPKIMKKTKNKQEGIEIASTWKQVQSVLNPSKTSEKRYSQEFKNKIIRDSEEKGQKTVALEYKIPYNEISRWRLEAKKSNPVVPPKKTTSGSDLKTTQTSVSEVQPKTNIKKTPFDSSKELTEAKDSSQHKEQESLKIKIKLSSLGHAATSSVNNKLVDKDTKKWSEKSEEKNTRVPAVLTNPLTKSSETFGKKSKESTDSGNFGSKTDTHNEKAKGTQKPAPVSINEDVDLRIEVINFCLELGVLKTQKKFNVTRQSIIDLMKEYDELNKYEVNKYNKNRREHSFKTRLISREKTSVEVTNAATQPVIVKNLNDYIVTQEYMQTVVEYALKHGITAATRKYKRKTNTVRSWINRFQKQVKKKISVEQVAKEKELLANNMSVEDARQISNLEARKKRQLLEAEFRRHIVEFAREFGITSASRRFKKKAATVKSWMAHCMKNERDAKRQEEAEAKQKQTAVQESNKSQRSNSPRAQLIRQDSTGQKSPSSSRQKSPPQSPIWEQDFVIKPSSNSPLKLTFSPRRKSSPVIVIGSSTDDDAVDDETNDIETDDEQENENLSGDYLEVAAWDVNSSESRSEAVVSSSQNYVEYVTNFDNIDSGEKTSTVVVVITDDDKDSTKRDTSAQKPMSDIEKRTLLKNISNNKTGASGFIEKSPSSVHQANGQTSLIQNTDSLQDDIFISPTEVPNIFENDDIHIDNNMQSDGNVIEENTSTVYNSDLQKTTECDLEKADISDETRDNAGNMDDADEDIMTIPYEETVMFKVLTEEVDSFIKSGNAVVKYNRFEVAAGKPRDEAAPIKTDIKDGELGPIKKFKKYADAEIMKNIEETYLFTGSRVTRQAASKDLKENFEANDKEQVVKEKDVTDNRKVEEVQEKISSLEDKTEDKIIDEPKSHESIKGNLESEEIPPKSASAEKSDDTTLKNDTTEKTDKEITDTAENNEKECITLKKKDEKESKYLQESDEIHLLIRDSTTEQISEVPKKGERSIFDMLAGTSDKPEVHKSSSDTTDIPLQVNAEKNKGKPNAFGLFGNLIKQLNLPQVVDVQDSASDADNVLPSDDKTEDIGKDKRIEEKSELAKDKSERNLFDFIKLEPKSPTSPDKSSSVESQSPRRQTRSLSRSGVSPVKSPHTPSPVKLQPVKKPMFKFPKLASPINFGNIAKLGLIKIKEEVKAKENKECIKEEDNTIREVEEEVSDKDIGNVCEKQTVSDCDIVETCEEGKVDRVEKSEEEKVEVVMETFEQLRQRLATERAANKLEKERVKAALINAESSGVDEIDGSKELLPDEQSSFSGEIEDDEMYKDFTPQKIVLILDISKKHGIDFASTSFGLPVSVVVNWIIEKDRKQRKAALSVSLEDKLKALKDINDGSVTKEDVKKRINIDTAMLDKWENEIGWLLKTRNVCDVLEKWTKVEAVSNLNFEECGKNLERNESLTEKENSKSKVNRIEDTEKLSDTATVDEFDDNEVIITGVEKPSDEKSSKTSNEKTDEKSTEVQVENQSAGRNIEIQAGKDSVGEGIEIEEVRPLEPQVKKNSSENNCEAQVADSEFKETDSTQNEIPDIFSFVQTTKPRDFTVEQKAMFVLLVQKYGGKTVSKKFGINSGTMYTWQHGNRQIRRYLYEQSGSKVYKDVDPTTKKMPTVNQPKTRSVSDCTEVKETNSGKEKKETEPIRRAVRSSDTKVSAAVIQPEATEKETLENDLVDHPKGYRIISPTKLPSLLRDLKKCQTKDYTLEQKVAIVKLVQLYGVRTIHKQFRIPAGSIWNWQHAKNVKEVLKSERNEGDKGAQKEIDFDTAEDFEDEMEEETVTIDTILDRVLITSDSINHLNFNQDQKADAVCLINHFGIDYFCEKVPQIPRGTLWNWRHNRHLTTLVDRRLGQIKQYSDRLNEMKGNKHRENVVGEAVDKSDMTKKWVKNIQGDGTEMKDSYDRREGSRETVKRKRNVEDESSSIMDKKKKPKLGPMSYKRKFSGRKRRSVSPMSAVSEISVHSNDFEEILSDDEIKTPSVVSRKSIASTHTVESNKNGSVLKAGKGYSSGKSENRLPTHLGSLDSEKIEEPVGPVHEVIRIETGAFDRLMVCYVVQDNKTAPGSQGKSIEVGSKRPAQSEAAASQPPAKKRAHKEGEVSDSSGNWVPLDEYYYGTNEGDASYTEEKGEYRFKCWYCCKMLYNNVRAMQHIQGHIDASKQQNIDLSDLTQCKYCYKQFDTPFEMQTHVEKVHLSNKVLMCRICERDFATPRELMVHMKSNHHACEMPYVCHLCQFRSSMYSDVVDHFKKKHDSSNHMLCLYCLRAFEVKFVSQGWGQTQTYYGHLLKHQSKTMNKKCVVCRLTFFNVIDVKNHRRTCHVSSVQDMKALSQGKSDSAQKQKKGSTLKSLNAPSVSRIQDYGDIAFPRATSKSKCIECKMMMSTTDHYKKYVHCSMCRFATSCSVAYANHMMGFHSGQMSSLNLNIPWERPMKVPMYCICGFSSKFGNKVANHLVYCAKWTCSTKKLAQSSTGAGKAELHTGQPEGLQIYGKLEEHDTLDPDCYEAPGSGKSDKFMDLAEQRDARFSDEPHGLRSTDEPHGLGTIDEPHDLGTADEPHDSDVSESDVSEKSAVELMGDVEGESNDMGNEKEEYIEKIPDMDFPLIFVRKPIFKEYYCRYLNEDKRTKMKRMLHNHGTHHACYYCGKLLSSHFLRHMVNKHPDEEVVRKIVSCSDPKIKENLKDILRGKGDNEHNKKVVAAKKGELILFRRPFEAFKHTDFGPCKVCFEWMLKRSLRRHLSSCKGDIKASIPEKDFVKTISDINKGISTGQASQMLIREVFTLMKMDNIGMVARFDQLIVSLGEKWIKSCTDNTVRRGYLASERMRLAAKLLICLRKLDAGRGWDTFKKMNKSMWDFLRPVYVPCLHKAALEITLPDMDDIDDLKNPSNSMKIKNDLITMLEEKVSLSGQQFNRTGDVRWNKYCKEAEAVLIDTNRFWKIKWTKLAWKLMRERKLGITEKLPSPKELEQLGMYLNDRLSNAELNRNEVTWLGYRELMVYSQARVLMYNRRSSGEIENIRLKNYAVKLETDDFDEELMREISTMERHLMDSHRLIQIEGKRTAIVPLLIPPECKQVLDFLADADVRKKVNIHPRNDFLFPSSGEMGPRRAYDSFATVCTEFRLTRPEQLTSTESRKYMATLSQVMNSAPSELEQVCRHLEHTTQVHLKDSGATSPHMKKVNVCKILLMQDLNLQSYFVGKKLEEVEFKDMLKQCQTELPPQDAPEVFSPQERRSVDGVDKEIGEEMDEEIDESTKDLEETEEEDREETMEIRKDKKEGSLLGMLGLVQKSTVATKIRNVEKPKPVPEKKVLDKVEVVKKNADDIKPDTKPVKETAEPVMPILKKESEEKHVSDEKNKAVVKENKADRNQIIDQNVSEDLPQKDTEKTEKSTQKVETIKISDSGRDKIETYISNENLTEARGDTGESQEEPETVDKENPTETSEIQKDIELDKSEKDPMEADEVEQIHEVHEEAHAISDEAKHSDEDDQAKDEEEMDTDTVNEPGVTPVDSQNDTCEETKQADDATEPVELIDETDKSLATDTLEETMVTEEKELKKDLIDEEKAEPLKQTDIEDIETKEAAAESLKEDENYTEEEQGPEDDTEDHLKKTEELTETETDKPALAESTDESYPAELDKDISQPITTDDILTGEEGKIEESEAAETTKDQDMVKSAENEQKDSEVHKEEEAEDKEASASQASEIKGDDDDTETKCLDDEKKADDQRKSSERSAEGRGSVDRHSSDSRESSEQHSRDRQDSHERHHSGSGDRSHHDGRSHDSDKYRHDNRSHGSNRSDSYHGNRSSYDSNRDRDRSYDRDRDRSYDRDRDRDYNRNRNYRDNRHGDNRSGGYGYQDNRGQGYGGGQGYRNSQGQYGGYQGNRGDHHQDRNRGGHQQDRNYNRNHQNRGGYNQNRGGNNQNYRGGYRGGYY